MGTIALATAASPATAAEKDEAPAEKTVEMPAVSHSLVGSTTQAADALKTTALRYQLRQAQQSATASALKTAQDTKKKAEAKAEARAEARKKAEEAREKAAAASRSADRTVLAAATHATGGNVSSLVSFLRAQVGKPYVMGGTGPSSFDCSGLTQAAFKQVGVSLPRTSQPQSTAGTPVSLDALQVGDLLYWGSAGSAYHVAVFVGDGKFIGAQNSSTGIVERPLSYDEPTGAVRVL